MRSFRNYSYHGIDTDAKFDVLASDPENNSWLFLSTHKLERAKYNDAFHESIDVHIYEIPYGRLGVSFYRVIDDEEGVLRLVGHGLHDVSISTNQVLSAAKKLMPSFPKKAWELRRDRLYLKSESDRMLFQLSYGGAHA